MMGSSAADFLAMSSCSRLLKATREVLAVDADRKRIGLYESSSPLVLLASVSTLGTAVHFLSAEQVDLCAIVLTNLPTIGGMSKLCSSLTWSACNVSAMPARCRACQDTCTTVYITKSDKYQSSLPCLSLLRHQFCH